LRKLTFSIVESFLFAQDEKVFEYGLVQNKRNKVRSSDKAWMQWKKYGCVVLRKSGKGNKCE
jgi:hypothetical protein